MSGLSLTQCTVITREFARRTRAIELNTTDAADVVLGHVPPPGRDGVPLLDSDLHYGCPKVERMGGLEAELVLSFTIQDNTWRFKRVKVNTSV